jgi:ribosomal protein S18 acetylase RimI-like enzyme
MEKNIEIRFVKTWDEKDIINLYKAGGWWKESWSSINIRQMIKGSFVFAVAIDSTAETVIGMGRVISDGISDGYIQDLVVMRDYRHTGVGKMIVNKLIESCLSKDIKWIGLIAEPGNEMFFSSLNFKIMKKHTPMLYNIEE